MYTIKHINRETRTRGIIMSINSRRLRLYLARLITSAVVSVMFSSAAVAADSRGSIFLDPPQQIFAAQPVSTPEEPDATKFTVTPPNYNAASGTSGYTFVWTFTADNSAGGNAEDITFT